MRAFQITSQEAELSVLLELSKEDISDKYLRPTAKVCQHTYIHAYIIHPYKHTFENA